MSQPFSPLNRRHFLRRAGLATGSIAALASSAGLVSAVQPAQAQLVPLDVDLLNFALNLEYLEAEFYVRGLTGQGLEAQGIDVTGQGTLGSVIVKANSRVQFRVPWVREFLAEITADEVQHVRFIRETIKSLGGTPIARPELDLLNSFNAIAQLAGIGSSFDPFENEVNFILAAENFETVGVTAYRGAAPLLTNKTVISGSAGILAVEAYHSAILRLLEVEFGFYPQKVTEISDRLAALRTALTADPAVVDQGVLVNDQPNLVPTNANALAFARTPRQVLNIDYGAINASKGGFFPKGVNGIVP
ncbi:MAG TPA: ferritin-like domain-containing protein [Chthoniobacterales bacterium]